VSQQVTVITHPADADLEFGRIEWQNGLMRDVGRNGAFVEEVIQVAIDRIQERNVGAFACRENSLAITKLEEALHWLNHRTERRRNEGTLDTYKGP